MAKAEMTTDTEVTVTGVARGVTMLTLRALGGVTKEIGLAVIE